MPDRDVTFHRSERLFVEYLADQTQILEHDHLRAVGDGDTCGFLAAVLQGVQAVVRHLGDVFAGCPYSEYAALFAGGILVLVDRLGGHVWGCSLRAVGDGAQSTVTVAHYASNDVSIVSVPDLVTRTPLSPHICDLPSPGGRKAAPTGEGQR